MTNESRQTIQSYEEYQPLPNRAGATLSLSFFVIAWVA